MIQKSKGILIVLSGFSGSGKGTIMKELMKKYSEQYALSMQLPVLQDRERQTVWNIFLRQKSSLRK